MVHLPCKCTFRIFEPTEETRFECPQVLVVSRGVHSHPIPLPSKTPGVIRDEIFSLLRTLDEDLADLTPHRFLRNTALKAYLQSQIPSVKFPVLADLHIPLANRAHLHSYITRIKNECFPYGTGWDGKP